MPKSIQGSPITEEEVDNLSMVGGGNHYKWEFPEEAFNGDWWVTEVPNSDVASVLNSYRNQCEAQYKTRATVRRLTDGRLAMRRLADKPIDRSKAKGKK